MSPRRKPLVILESPLLQAAATLLVYAFYACVLGLSLVPSALLLQFAFTSLTGAPALLRTLLICLCCGGALYLYFITGILVMGITIRILSWGIGPGQYPLQSLTTIRWMIYSGLYMLAGTTILTYVPMSFLSLLFFRLMGARIGRNVQVNTWFLNDAYLLELGDNVVIGGKADISCHTVEIGRLILLPVKIGANTLIGQRCYINPGVTIGKNCTIGQYAFVRKLKNIPDNTVISALAGLPFGFVEGFERANTPTAQMSDNVPPSGAEMAAGLAAVDFSTRMEVLRILEGQLGATLDEESLHDDTRLEELGLDSLARMEVVRAVEQRFGFSSAIIPLTFGSLLALAGGLLQASPAESHAPQAWFQARRNAGKLELCGDFIAQAFVRRALKSGGDVAAADDMSGVLTYTKLLAAALAMGKEFAKMPEQNVGVMLPSSVAADIVFMALHTIGKLPVMLNWTTGPANLAHAASTMELTHVVTSRRFVERLKIEIPGIEHIFMEDVRKRVGKAGVLKMLLRIALSGDSLVRALPPRSPGDTAVVLFTSGSEKAPKAVPLTHRNLLENIRSSFEALDLTAKDSLCAFLPPFHSFGLTATMLMPLLGGMPVVHHPDPTDSKGLAGKVASYRPTMILGTPTFLSYLLGRVTRPEDFASVKTVVAGAEKCPPALFDRLAELAPRAELLEGYGITECSPVLTVNPPGAARRGTIGKPVPRVTARIVDVATGEDVPAGVMGMMQFSGPNVFPGYFAYDGESPFVERDGARWYVTGDLGVLDHDGYITFSGRLKRFIKAGGEMIALPAIEEPLAVRYPAAEEGPRVAVEGVETERGKLVVLFTTVPSLTRADANAILQSAGLHAIMHVDKVIALESIPVLGTGKTDYKVLRATVEELAKG